MQHGALIFDGLGHPIRVAIFLHLLKYGRETKAALAKVAGIGRGIKDHMHKMQTAGLIEVCGNVQGIGGRTYLYRLNPKVCHTHGGLRTIDLADLGILITAHS